jgi:hypothetical protein
MEVHMRKVACCAWFVVLALALIVSACTRSGSQPTSSIVLLEGSNSWEVFVGGQRVVWNLAYSSYDELPIKNSDYGKVVVYQGVKHTLWRVYSNQIQVSSPI